VGGEKEEAEMNTKLKKTIAKEGLLIIGILLLWFAWLQLERVPSEYVLLLLLFLFVIYGMLRFARWAIVTLRKKDDEK